MAKKPSIVISCPVDTYSGYGARARDFVKALLKLGYDVSILSQRWGNTRFGYLDDHNEADLKARIIPELKSQPDVWIQCTVPNEFQPIGKFNIGLTAGMETTLVHNTWIDGCNRMDLVITSSKHSAQVFTGTSFDKKDQQGNMVGQLKLEKPIDVLFEGVDTSKYKKGPSKIDLLQIKESFAFLQIGHWMQGDIGQDRKNIGYTVKTFLETFKNKRNAPALILKTQVVGTSLNDQKTILERIDNIRKTVKGTKPNIYLIHGEMSDDEINQLYNHPKVKAFVSHTKGEGFGRPLLEFTTTGKPVIASGWSGQLDFLHKDMSILVGGNLAKVHPSAAVKDMILTESEWFQPDDAQVAYAYEQVWRNYKKYEVLAKKQMRNTLANFTFDAMVESLELILNERLPEFPEEVALTLPKLNLPKLEAI